MRTLLAVLTLLSLQPALAATPRCTGGRFLVDGEPIELGPRAERIAAIAVDDAVVRVDGCDPAAARRARRRRATLVRALLRGCGDAARTRLRIRLPDGCAGARIRVRRRGVSIADRALRLDPGLPPDPGDAVSPPPPAAVSLVPTLAGFSPDHGAPGDVITVFGTNLDRDRNGDPWQGAPPWRVVFPPRLTGTPGVAQSAPFTFVSATELQVTVPPLAATGRIALAEPRAFTATAVDFAVVSALPAFDLRVENQSQYDVVSLRQDGVERLVDPDPVLPLGGTIALGATPGTVRLDIAFGIGAGTAPLFTRSETVTVTGDTRFSIPAIGIAELLTGFQPSRDWSSAPDAGGHFQTIRFEADGTWLATVDGSRLVARRGVVGLVSWPGDALVVTFRLADDLPPVSIATPFTSFIANGLLFVAQ
jgi:uncharacterized protein (TIGR03437 family)